MGEIAKQGIRGTVITYAGVFVGFLTTFFVLTRFLTAQEIGLARVLLDAATLFISLAQLGTSSSIIRFYPYFCEKQTDKSINEHGFFFWTSLIPLIGFVVVTALYLIFAEDIKNLFIDKSPLISQYYYFVIPIAFFMLYQVIAETSANARMHIVFPRGVRELGVRIGLLIAYLLYAFRVLSIDGFVISLAVVYALATLADSAYLFSLGNISLMPDWQFIRNNKSLIQDYFKYTGILILSALSTVLAPSLSSFFLTAQLGLDYTGVFAIATYIAVMVSIPQRAVTAIASPQLAQAMKESDMQQVSQLTKQVSNNLFLIGGLILIAIWINIDLIYNILPNGATYSTARQTVLILGFSQLLIASYTISINTLNYSPRYYLSLLWSLVLTISAILLNNYLIPIYGMNGGAMANLLSYAIYFTLIIISVWFTTRTIAISKGQIKMVSIIAIVLLLNWLISLHTTEFNIWLVSVIKSIVLLGGTILAIYKWQISKDFNEKLCDILSI